MLRIIFTRHGETQWNIEGRCQGQTDIELTEKGLSQGKILAQRLKGLKFENIYSSDLKRAYDTSLEIQRAQNEHVKIINEPLLREYSFGCWEGLTSQDIRSKYLELFLQRELKPDVEIPQAELYSQLQKRCFDFVEKCKERHSSGTVLAVTHSMFIKALIHRYFMIPWEVLKKQMYFDNCSLTIIKIKEEKVVLETLNDTAHFQSVIDVVEARH